MTDQELEVYLGIAGKKGAAKIIADLSPSERAVWEDMARVEAELELWQKGLGPKPKGVIICERRRR